MSFVTVYLNVLKSLSYKNVISLANPQQKKNVLLGFLILLLPKKNLLLPNA